MPVFNTKDYSAQMIFLGFKNWGSDLLPPWQILEANLDGCWGFYACKPPLASRTVARTFVVSAHLPHRQRDDCIDTWQSVNSELESFLQHRRLQDIVIILHGTSYELGATERCMNPNTVDERGFIADIQQRHGLITTKPSTHTHMEQWAWVFL